MKKTKQVQLLWPFVHETGRDDLCVPMSASINLASSLHLHASQLWIWFSWLNQSFIWFQNERDIFLCLFFKYKEPGLHIPAQTGFRYCLYL